MDKEDSTFIIRLPIRTVSEANSSEFWRIKAKRHKEQKKMIFDYWAKFNPVIKLPANVVLIRVAPRELDSHDNLRVSFKYLTDAISECLTGIKKAGRADSDKRITWDYKQEKGNVREYAIRIEIQPAA